MVIENRKEDNLKKIEDIKTGECFIYEDRLYMKTNVCNTKNDIECVIVETGVLYHLYAESYVIPVRAKVVIE